MFRVPIERERTIAGLQLKVAKAELKRRQPATVKVIDPKLLGKGNHQTRKS